MGSNRSVVDFNTLMAIFASRPPNSTPDLKSLMAQSQGQSVTDFHRSLGPTSEPIRPQINHAVPQQPAFSNLHSRLGLEQVDLSRAFTSDTWATPAGFGAANGSSHGLMNSDQGAAELGPHSRDNQLACLLTGLPTVTNAASLHGPRGPLPGASSMYDLARPQLASNAPPSAGIDISKLGAFLGGFQGQPWLLGGKAEPLSPKQSADSLAEEAPVDGKLSDLGKRIEEQFAKRMAQNREAARRSRMKKKAYIQLLEQNKARLAELESELRQVRQKNEAQAAYLARGSTVAAGALGSGAALHIEYESFMEDFKKTMLELQQIVDSEQEHGLSQTLDKALSQLLTIFKKKQKAAKSDVFHLLSGAWKSPVERCFMFVGGFKPSHVVRLIITHAGELTDKQGAALQDLLQGTKQEEERITRLLEELQEALLKILTTSSSEKEQEADSSTEKKGVDFEAYMRQMSSALNKLTQLEQLVVQSDALRFGCLAQSTSLLNPKQGAMGLLAVFGEVSRMRLLSQLWEKSTNGGPLGHQLVMESLQQHGM